VRLEEQKYGYILIMIVQIVLVIVTAVQVNSQELCPSVCQCNGDNTTCAGLFSDVTNVTQETFHSGLRVLRVTGRTNLEREEDLFLRWNITSLTSLDLSRNNITKIWQRAFYSLADLEELDLTDNSITTLESQTFYNNTRLFSLFLSENRITDIGQSTFQENVRLKKIYMNFNKITSIDPELFKNNVELGVVQLAYNRITDIHRSTFRNNRRLYNVNLLGNKIISIDQETFNQNWELKLLDLSDNSISDIHPSTFRNNSRLISLDISTNKITSIKADTFIHNRKLTFLYLQGNNITEISNLSFRGLEQLVVLNVSNNNIEELNPLVFHNTLNRTNGQNHQASKLKIIHLEKNKIRSFNFELYFPMSGNSDSSIPKFQLLYLNLNSNRLTTLDVASVKWLNQTNVTDLTDNPWNCDCSMLFEVWRELKHKLTLQCASPREMQGKSWDVMEEFCSQVAEVKLKKSNTSSEAVRPGRGRKEESEVNTKSGVSSMVTTTLIVTGILLVCGVLLVCGISVGLILPKVVKRLRNRQKTPEYCDVYDPRTSYVSMHSYAEVGAGPSVVRVQSYEDVGKRASYISILS